MSFVTFVILSVGNEPCSGLSKARPVALARKGLDSDNRIQGEARTVREPKAPELEHGWVQGMCCYGIKGENECCN
ncbi:MAG: hypothetical protein LUE19_05090 [Clostridiales bacterium]|nr:hypothetical protein [Clostridiales bacterium]